MPGTLAHLERTPRDVARWQKAQQQLLGGQPGPALAAYRDLARRYPAVPELWFELGNAAAGELDFALASQAYRRVVELAPNNANLLVMVGRQYQGLRQLDQARAAFERAVAADPASVDARISLASERGFPPAVGIQVFLDVPAVGRLPRMWYGLKRRDVLEFLQ